MSSHGPVRPVATRKRSKRLIGAIAAGTLLGVVALQFTTSTTSLLSAGSTTSLLSASSIPGLSSLPVAPAIEKLHPGHRGGFGEADGELAVGVSVFDNSVPAVTKLDPELRSALRRAATDAGRVRFMVESGWRSSEYQQELFRQAVSKYGSEKAASRWVATAETSAHVSGDAVDIGPANATAWLAKHGAKYGLCQTYKNEPWHYEVRPQAVDEGCPPMYADPTHDPRMQQ